MSPKANDWDAICYQIKNFLPEIEDDSERGRTIRLHLNDLMAKLICTMYGQEKGVSYAEAFRDDPLDGLKTFPGIANALLRIIIARRIQEKRSPMAVAEDFQEWFLGHKEKV